jgi:hypothetical protein
VVTFTTPVIIGPGPSAVLTFQLVVTNANGVSSPPAFMTVTVYPVVRDTVTITLVEYRTGKQRLIVNAVTDASPPGVAVLTAQPFDANGNAQGPAQVMTFSLGIYAIDVVGAVLPTTVQVRSNYGGSASSPVTRLRQ